MSTNQIVPGSIAAVAQQTGKSIAESFLSADAVILVDTSGSMHANDSRNGRSRYDVACEELKKLQAELPGKLALLSFSSDVRFCPAGIPTDFGEQTNLSKALKFAKQADINNMRFIVISDGEPDSEGEAIFEAKKYKNRIDTIFVGPDGGAGQDFLRRLAKASGGQNMTSAQVKELATDVRTLLLTA